MSNLRKKYSIDASIDARDVKDIAEVTGNIYESLNVIARRSNQIARDMKEELQGKLNEFATVTDNLEEVHENKEQIEISRFYERMPHPTLLSLEEFMRDDIYYRIQEPEKKAPARKKR